MEPPIIEKNFLLKRFLTESANMRRRRHSFHDAPDTTADNPTTIVDRRPLFEIGCTLRRLFDEYIAEMRSTLEELERLPSVFDDREQLRRRYVTVEQVFAVQRRLIDTIASDIEACKSKIKLGEPELPEERVHTQVKGEPRRFNLSVRHRSTEDYTDDFADEDFPDTQAKETCQNGADVEIKEALDATTEDENAIEDDIFALLWKRIKQEGEDRISVCDDPDSNVPVSTAQVPPTQNGEESNASWRVEFTEDYLRWHIKQEAEETGIENLSGSTVIPDRSISVSTEIESPDEGNIKQSEIETAALKREENLEAQTQNCKTDAHSNRSDSTEILDCATAEPAPKISTTTTTPNNAGAEDEQHCAPDSTVTEEDLAVREESNDKEIDEKPYPGGIEIVHNDLNLTGLTDNLFLESSNREVENEAEISTNLVPNVKEDVLDSSFSTTNLSLPDLDDSNDSEASVNEKSDDQKSDDSLSNVGDDEDLLVPIEVHEVPSDDPDSAPSIKAGKRTDDEQDSLMDLLSKIVDSDSFSSSTTESDEEEEQKEKAVKRPSVEEPVMKKCSVVIKLNTEDMRHVKVNSDVKRLFNLDSLESNRRRRILSTSSESSNDSRKAKRKRLRLKRPKSKEFVSDSDSDATTRESGVSDFSMDNIVPSGEEYKDDDLDADDILKNMCDSDEELTDVEDEEGEETAKKKRSRSGVKATKENDDKMEPKDDWKSDALLTKSLNVSDPVVENGTKLEEKLNRLDKMVDERMRQIYGGDKKDPLGDDDVDSEIEFVSITKGTKRKRAIVVDSDESSESSVEEVDFDDSTPLKGRRNIRAVISEDTLEETTKLAKLQEEQHEERLQEKRRKMELILSQSDMSEQDVNLMLDVLGEQTIKVNEKLARALKEHQKKGIQFMWDACYESIQALKDGHLGNGCILAHCMGLGKTLQVVTLVRTLYAHQDITGLKRVLVVCPLSTVLNWKNEFNIGERIADDGMKIDVDVIFSKDKAMRTSITSRWMSNGGVLVMGYETFVSLTRSHDDSNEQEKLLYQALVDPGADLVVCDEGHLLKNNKTSRTQCLSSVLTKRRIVLTGTPMQNNLDEYYHMVQFVKPNLLGTYKEFRNRFINPITNGQYHDSTEFDIILMKRRSHVLHSMLKNTLQRYEVTELQTYLPEKLDFVLFVPLHDVQKRLYKKSIELMSAGRIHKTLIKCFSFLQPIWTHPHLLEVKEQRRMSRIKAPTSVPANEGAEQQVELEESHIEGVPDDWWKSDMPEDCATNVAYGPKFEIVLNIVRECEKAQDKVLIFSTYLYELDVLERFLHQDDPKWKRDVNYLRMDGMVQSHTREEYCMRFNKAGSKFQLMLITHRVGGLGLNLTAANRVVLMDVCWNPSYDSQAIFRIYRFGQTKPCYVYRLVSLGTMEEVVYERSVTKLAIAGRVVDEMQISRHYKSNDVVYRCNLDTSEERPVPKLPPDSILATLLQVLERQIYKYHEHESLLMNLPEEELDETEMKLAWEEFNLEKEKRRTSSVPELTVPGDMTYNPVPKRLLYNPVYLNNFLPRQTDPNVPSTSAETTRNPMPPVLQPNMSRIIRNLNKLQTRVVYVNPTELAQENVPSIDVRTSENGREQRSSDVIEIE